MITSVNVHIHVHVNNHFSLLQQEMYEA